MEESGDQEDNGEAGAEGTEEKAPDSEDPDKEKNPEEPPDGETDKEGDENGVIYHYYGYEDGTAEIYELEDCKE